MPGDVCGYVVSSPADKGTARMDAEEYREEALEVLRHQAVGGWRRAVTGLLVGAGLGLVVTALTRRDPST